jgi:hypothetical protein
VKNAVARWQTLLPVRLLNSASLLLNRNAQDRALSFLILDVNTTYGARVARRVPGGRHDRLDFCSTWLSKSPFSDDRRVLAQTETD